MSKVRRSGSKRLIVVKDTVSCKNCGNNKAHSNGLWLKCTKCKSNKVIVTNHDKFHKTIEDMNRKRA